MKTGVIISGLLSLVCTVAIANQGIDWSKFTLSPLTASQAQAACDITDDWLVAVSGFAGDKNEACIAREPADDEVNVWMEETGQTFDQECKYISVDRSGGWQLICMKVVARQD